MSKFVKLAWNFQNGNIKLFLMTFNLISFLPRLRVSINSLSNCYIFQYIFCLLQKLLKWMDDPEIVYTCLAVHTTTSFVTAVIPISSTHYRYRLPLMNLSSIIPEQKLNLPCLSANFLNNPKRQLLAPII